MINILFEKERSRAAAYDGDKEIGDAGISESQGVWTLDHTNVDPAYQGQKVGERLVEAIVENARQEQVKIVPLCPYALHQFEKKSAYADVWQKQDL